MFRKVKVTYPIYVLQNNARYKYLAGIWEDTIGMRRCTLIPSLKDKGYKVIEDRKIKEKGKALITFSYNDDDSKVMLTAPWGENATKRTWSGRVEENGNKIVWDGWRGTQTWFKVDGKYNNNSVIFDLDGRILD